jgi:hypothetical protein
LLLFEEFPLFCVDEKDEDEDGLSPADEPPWFEAPKPLRAALPPPNSPPRRDVEEKGADMRMKVAENGVLYLL